MIYFGDHLFSDLRGPSKAGWRTAAIIHELEVSLLYLIYSRLGHYILKRICTSFKAQNCALSSLCDGFFIQREIKIQNEDSYRFEQVQPQLPLLLLMVYLKWQSAYRIYASCTVTELHKLLETV